MSTAATILAKQLTRENSQEPGSIPTELPIVQRMDSIAPPGGMPFCQRVDSCTASYEGERKLKRDDESVLPEADRGDSKSASEASFQNIFQWKELLTAIKQNDQVDTLRLILLYSNLLAKECNRSRVITLMADLISHDMNIGLKSLLDLVKIKSIEKEFAFQYFTLPLAYALDHRASLATLETLVNSGASLSADYIPGLDITEKLEQRLALSRSGLDENSAFVRPGDYLPYFATTKCTVPFQDAISQVEERQRLSDAPYNYDSPAHAYAFYDSSADGIPDPFGRRDDNPFSGFAAPESFR